VEHLWSIIPEDAVKLLAAFIIGALLGAEREYHDKSAGMRTLILICVGSTLFTIFSTRIAGTGDPGRIAAQIVSGVGFIGAGVILQRRGQIRGLTTASTIWITAALGIGVGVGYLLFTALAAVIAIYSLSVLPHVERVLERKRMFRVYKIVMVLDEAKAENLIRLIQGCNLSVREESRGKREGKLVAIWSLGGRPENHAKAVSAMLADPEVMEIDY
jgi:putative Mg2+ transporter-C (MgtC) family protein